MNDDSFDLLVIGGGASGACLTYEAVSRGLKVALIEGHDLGGGTSSRSTTCVLRAREGLAPLSSLGTTREHCLAA